MCIEVSRSPTTPAARPVAAAPGITAEGGEPHEETGEEKHRLLGHQPRRAMPRRMVQRRRVPGPHHDELQDRGRNRREQPGSLAHRIEPPSGDPQREERRRHGHHAHVHRHVREEGLPRELRQRPQPHGGEREHIRRSGGRDASVTAPDEDGDERRVEDGHRAQARQQQGGEAQEAVPILRRVVVVRQGRRCR